MHPRRAKAEAATFRALMRLPPRVMRRLAGPPLVVDGQTLDLEMQWTLRMAELFHEPGAETLPWDEARDTVRRHAAMTGGTHPVGETRNLSTRDPTARSAPGCTCQAPSPAARVPGRCWCSC